MPAIPHRLCCCEFFVLEVMSSADTNNQRFLNHLLASSEVRSRKTVPLKVAYLFHDCGIPAQLLKERFGLSKTTVYKYIRKNGDVQPRRGRLDLLTPEETAIVTKEIQKASEQNQPPTTPELVKMVLIYLYCVLTLVLGCFSKREQTGTR